MGPCGIYLDCLEREVGSHYLHGGLRWRAATISVRLVRHFDLSLRQSLSLTNLGMAVLFLSSFLYSVLITFCPLLPIMRPTIWVGTMASAVRMQLSNGT